MAGSGYYPNFQQPDNGINANLMDYSSGGDGGNPNYFNGQRVQEVLSGDPFISRAAMNIGMEVAVPAVGGGDPGQQYEQQNQRQESLYDGNNVNLIYPGSNTHMVAQVVNSFGGEPPRGNVEVVGRVELPYQDHSNIPASDNTGYNTTSMCTDVLSNIPVFKVIAGRNGECLFMIPPTPAGHDKDTAQQLMNFQTSAEELHMRNEAEAHVQNSLLEQMEHLDIGMESGSRLPLQHITPSEGSTVNSGEREVHYENQGKALKENASLVMVSGDNSAMTSGAATSVKQANLLAMGPQETTSSSPSSKEPETAEKFHANEMSEQESTPSTNTKEASKNDRPKRKAAIEAAKMTEAAFASLHSHRKSASTKRKSSKNPVIPVVTAAKRFKKAKNYNSEPSNEDKSNLEENKQQVMVYHRPALVTSSEIALKVPHQQDQDDLPEIGDEKDIRRCIVCLRWRPRHLTEDIYENVIVDGCQQEYAKPALLPNITTLIKPLGIQVETEGKPEKGICADCTEPLKKFHIFKDYASQCHAHEAKKSVAAHPVSLACVPFGTLDDSQVQSNEFEETHRAAAYIYLTKRKMTSRDWDLFGNTFVSEDDAKIIRLKKSIMSRHKLTHLHCVKCNRLVYGGRIGYLQHWEKHHSGEMVVLPCDFCGNYFPDVVENSSSVQDYFSHWLKHFYLHLCENCGEKFQNEEGLRQHRKIVHSVEMEETSSERDSVLVRVAKPKPSNKSESHSQMINLTNISKEASPAVATRPWKCDLCNSSFQRRYMVIDHREAIHTKFNPEGVTCQECPANFDTVHELNLHLAMHRNEEKDQRERQVQEKKKKIEEKKISGSLKDEATFGNTSESEIEKAIRILVAPFVREFVEKIKRDIGMPERQPRMSISKSGSRNPKGKKKIVEKPEPEGISGIQLSNSNIGPNKLSSPPPTSLPATAVDVNSGTGILSAPPPTTIPDATTQTVTSENPDIADATCVEDAKLSTAIDKATTDSSGVAVVEDACNVAEKVVVMSSSTGKDENTTDVSFQEVLMEEAIDEKIEKDDSENINVTLELHPRFAMTTMEEIEAFRNNLISQLAKYDDNGGALG